MLTSISWQEFFAAISLILAIYYTISIFLLYSKEITGALKRQSFSIPITEDYPPSTESIESTEVMGSSKQQSPRLPNVPREDTTNSEDLKFISFPEASEDTN